MPKDTESADLHPVSFYMSKLLHLHFVQAATFREEQLNGRTFLVVPGVILQEQVLNYYFVPASEINHFVDAWNGVPVTNRHPDTRNGSANFTSYDGVIGRFYNAEFDASSKQLKGEFWLDLEVLRNSEDGRSMESRIRAGETIEVSTGYWADEEMTSGVWNDREYFAIHRNLRPDHVAVLLDQTGACSVADGCGMPRLNCAMCLEDKKLMQNLSQSKRRSLSMFKRFKKQNKPEPVALNIEDADTLAALQGLGLKVEKGKADGEYLVSNEISETPEPQGDPQPPAPGQADPFVNELRDAFEGIGGVQGFVTMLNELQSLLEAAQHNAQKEQDRKKALVTELKKNGACTLSETTLMKMDIPEIEAIQSNLNATLGNYSLFSEEDPATQNNGSNGQKRVKRGIGMAGSLKVKEA